MSDGTPVNRSSLVLLKNGIPAIDWGEGRFQDILSGDFLHCTENEIDHTIQDKELDQLILINRVYSYNINTVFLYPLPEPPRRTID
jgi:hypothetical protein